ncbi:MAG: 50S ribosomal protein L6 [Candidatus Gribaldobacteria bacterium]|nr:50S ribosomal protein L6 [Candidatus Gribaldobacteria bacterium]
MSRIGKKPIIIPQQVIVEIKGTEVKVKGPKGELTQVIPEDILIEQKDNQLTATCKRTIKSTPALWGLSRALLQNCVDGVSKGFERKLEIIGIGYKAFKESENKLKLEVGFSHSVFLDIPEGLTLSVEKNIIVLTGIDKQKIGQFAANIRKAKPPEPYKGKGIRYFGEKVRRKEGKKAGGK